MPARLHDLTVQILLDVLTEAGFTAGTEVTLKMDPDFQPIPDLIGTRKPLEQPDLTRAADVVVEVLSEDDAMLRVLSKCRAYQGWGVEQIYVVDPVSRVVFCWVDRGLEEYSAFAAIPVERVWLKLDELLG